MMRFFIAPLTALWMLAAGSTAFAQCGTSLPGGTVCGNPNPTVSVNRPTGQPTLGANGVASGSVTLNGATSGSVTIRARPIAGSTTFIPPLGNGTINQVLVTDGAGNTSWSTASGSGTVTSVGLSLPGIFTVSGSPVTGTGTLTGTLVNQSANLVWAGPASGVATSPSFRALVGADLPNPSSSSLGGVQSLAAVSSQWIRQISTSGVPTASQPAFTDISGALAPAQCPNPSASTLGCVQSLAAVTSKWINTISTSGVPTATQPAFSDISGSVILSQLPTISGLSVIGNSTGGTATPTALSASNVLDFIGSTRGQVLYRGASGWSALGVGTGGQVLTTGGAGADPAWATVTGTGTVTSVATGTGLTGGPVTTTGTILFASVSDLRILANVSGGSAAPIANTMTAILDATLGSTTGNILYRGASNWSVLAPGTNGQVLTQGASTPAWSNAGSVSNVVIAAGAGLSSSGTCNITTTGTCTLSFTGRAALSANTTFFVRSDGSDTICNGTVNASSASTPNCAYLTWNNFYKGITVAYDFNGKDITLKSGTTGTYAAGLFMSTSWVGGGRLFIDLAGSSIAETATKGIINDVVQPGPITLINSSGLGTGGNVSSTGFACIQNDQPSAMNIGLAGVNGISTGPCFDAHYEATQGAGIYLAAPINVIGAGGNGFVLTTLNGNFGFNGQTVNFCTSQTYSVGTVVAQGNSTILANSAVFALNPACAGSLRTVTGPRFSVDTLGSIYTAGAGDTFIPGSTAGVFASGGTYDGNMGINKITGVGTIQAPFPLIFQSNGATNAGIITTAQRWGFGNTTGALTPTNTRVVISENVTAVDAASPGLSPILHVVGADNAIGSIIMDGFANTPGLGFRRAQGTAASPTVVTAGQPIGSLFGLGYDASGNKYGYSGEVDFFSSETWSSTAHGGGIKFWSVVNATTTQVNSATLHNSGGFVVGSTADPGTGKISANAGFVAAGSSGLSVTKTVRASGGAADCTLIYTGGILTGGSC